MVFMIRGSFKNCVSLERGSNFVTIYGVASDKTYKFRNKLVVGVKNPDF